jgi:hypothetical protein
MEEESSVKQKSLDWSLYPLAIKEEWVGYIFTT